MTAKDVLQLIGGTPNFATFGEEGEISNICKFGWYEWVHFHESLAAFPLSSHIHGRCLGPANNEGNKMAQWVLKLNGDIVPRRTMHKLTADEIVRESEVNKCAGFDAEIKQRYSFFLHSA